MRAATTENPGADPESQQDADLHELAESLRENLDTRMMAATPAALQRPSSVSYAPVYSAQAKYREGNEPSGEFTRAWVEVVSRDGERLATQFGDRATIAPDGTATSVENSMVQHLALPDTGNMFPNPSNLDDKIAVLQAALARMDHIEAANAEALAKLSPSVDSLAAIGHTGMSPVLGEQELY